MKTIAGQLPPEVAAQLHPERITNEECYWSYRDQLLEQFAGFWIGFAGGKVVASGRSAVAVFHEAEASGLHPFVVCVGREDEPTRVRRISFPYDSGYSPEPSPTLTLEVRRATGVPGATFDRVIADTGADASVLPWSDCQRLQLTPKQGVQSLLSGIAGGTSAALSFQVWVWLDGKDRPCRLQADFIGNERILGRDVLNQLEVLFRGPAGEVVVNP